MATVSAAILTLLAIISLSLRAESSPQGCAKMVGVIEDGIPGEYVVKISRGVKSHVVVQIMLEMSTSECKGMVYRTRNTSDAPVKPITCSAMIYIERFGFAAKMSDAAVMWLCDKDAVEYIEPSYPVTLPTQPPTTPATEVTGSGDSSGFEIVPDNVQPTTTDGTVSTQTDTPNQVVRVTTNQPVPTTTNPTVPTTATCTKLRGDLLPVNNYLIMFQHDLPAPRMNDLYDLLNCIKEVDDNFNMSEMKPIFRGPVKGFYYDGLNSEAIMKLCESDIVDYIQVQGGATSTPTPQPTAIPDANVAPTTVMASTSLSATPTPVECDKLVKYEDTTEIIPNRYVLILKKYTSKTDMNELITQLKSFMNPEMHSSIEVKKVLPAVNMKMIMVEVNQAGLAWICQNEHVENIDYDKGTAIANPTSTTVAVSTSTSTTSTTVVASTSTSTSPSATPTPVACDKLVKYEDTTGIMPNRYVLILHKYTSQTDMNELIVQLGKLMMEPEESNLIQVKKVLPAVNMKMITVETNQAGLDWMCQNSHVAKIDYDKTMMPMPIQPPEPSDNLVPKCNKLRGTLPESGVSLCRIYMTKSNTQQDCSQFIEHMKAMNEDPNSGVQFTVKSVSHHRQRPMIKATVNLDAVNTICQTEGIESIRTLS